jgi:DNA-directed RNA polymerase sigma subunit (sigma70/sigma32)
MEIAEVVPCNSGDECFLANDTRVFSMLVKDHRLFGFPSLEPGPEHAAQVNEARELIQKLLRRLPKREKLIIEHIYGIGGREQRSAESLVGVVGISRQRIHQLHHWALAYLRREICERRKLSAEDILVDR